MRMGRTPLAAAFLAMGFATGAAQAQWAPTVKISGFGTFAGVHSTEHEADYVTSRVQPNGVGATHRWYTGLDSRLGVQGDVKFNDQLSGVVQVVAMRRWDNSFRPGLEWANLKYQVNPDFAVRVGRIAMPFFLYSDTRLVGYAQPWVRPPTEAYIIQPNTISDGVDALYRAQLGGFTHNLQTFYGRNNLKTPAGESNGPMNWGLNDTATAGDWTLRAAFTYSKVSIPSLDAISDLFGLFAGAPAPTGPDAARIASTYRGTRMDFRTLALGANYDPGRWFVTGEYINFRGESFIRGTQAWYVTGGYRYNAFTPYATYAASHNHTKSEPVVPGPSAPFYGILNSIINNPAPQHTVSLGVRWDFMRNTDLKVQFDHLKLGAGSSGTLTNMTPNYRPGGSVNLLTFAVDFIF